MINELAYNEGSMAAYEKFATGIPPIAQVMKFGKGAKGVAGPAPHVSTPGVTLGGAANPAVTSQVHPSVAGQPATTTPATTTPQAKPAFMDTWKGQAAMQLGVPMAMMGVQNMMTPSQPRDPNDINAR